MKSKKGVAPVIATILLVAFAVSLISIVINFGMGLVEGESRKCTSDVEIGFIEIDGQKEVCYNSRSEKVNIRIENTGTKIVDGVEILVIGEKDSNTASITTPLDPINELKFSVQFPEQDYGKVMKIEIVPKADDNGVLLLCSEKKIEIEGIGACQ